MYKNSKNIFYWIFTALNIITLIGYICILFRFLKLQAYVRKLHKHMSNNVMKKQISSQLYPDLHNETYKKNNLEHQSKSSITNEKCLVNSNTTNIISHINASALPHLIQKPLQSHSSDLSFEHFTRETLSNLNTVDRSGNSEKMNNKQKNIVSIDLKDQEIVIPVKIKHNPVAAVRKKANDHEYENVLFSNQKIVNEVSSKKEKTISKRRSSIQNNSSKNRSKIEKIASVTSSHKQKIIETTGSQNQNTPHNITNKKHDKSSNTPSENQISTFIASSDENNESISTPPKKPPRLYAKKLAKLVSKTSLENNSVGLTNNSTINTDSKNVDSTASSAETINTDSSSSLLKNSIIISHDTII